MPRSSILKATYIGCIAAFVAQPASGQELAYHLPKGSPAAGFQAKLMGCPEGSVDPLRGLDYVERNAVIGGKISKGELVRLNPRSPFLGSRSIALTFHSNGLLKTINADGEAKSGAILTSLFKTAAGAISFGGIPKGQAQTFNNLTLNCRDDIRKKVLRSLILKVQIAKAEGQIAAGKDLTGSALKLYERNQKEAASLEKQLTLSTSAKFSVKREELVSHFAGNATQFGKHYYVKPIDYSKWFNWPDRLPARAGQFGFCVGATVSRSDFQSSIPLPSRKRTRWTAKYAPRGKLASDKLQSRFVYLRPVPISFEVYALKARMTASDQAEKHSKCKAMIDEKKKPKLTLLKKGVVSNPQLSDYFTLPLGSGAFESKSSSAEFSKDGTLLSIGTKSSGPGTSISEGLSGALAAAEALRDGRMNAIQREIDLLKAENELELLLNPEAEKSQIVEEGVS